MFSLLSGFNKLFRFSSNAESAPPLNRRDDKKLVRLEEGRLKRRKCHVMYNLWGMHETIHYEFDVSDERIGAEGDDHEELNEEDYDSPTYKSLNIELLMFRNRCDPEKTRVDRVTCSVHQRMRMPESDLMDSDDKFIATLKCVQPPSTDFVIDVKSSILFSAYPENWWKPWKLSLFFQNLFCINGIDIDVGAKVFYPFGKYTEIVCDSDQQTRERAIRVYSEFCKRVGVSWDMEKNL